MEPDAVAIDTLTALGLTQYEARTYVGLVGRYGQTAYALSKVTRVPQPKIYEALRKLIDRGAVALVGTDPQRFAAVPPETLLGRLRSEFAERADAAERELARSMQSSTGADVWPSVQLGLTGRDALLVSARQMLAGAGSKVYLSAWGAELTDLMPALVAAEERGATIVLLVFGRQKVSLRDAHVFRHGTTSKMVYPNHQNRHLALVCDGADSLWGLYSPEEAWSGLVSQDRRMVSLVRGFIRHDIYVQKTYEQFGPEMEGVFGSGMELLADVLTDQVRSNAAARGRAVRSSAR